MCLITVFTPTYNRASLLPHLYNSLCFQSFKDFEWLLIDDGSTDNTEKLVNVFIEEDIVNIRYYRQENGGKHRAFNRAIDLANGKIFSIVDSDDTLFEDALAVLWDEYQKVRDDNSICRISNPIMFKSFPIYNAKSYDSYIGDFGRKYPTVTEFWDSFKATLLVNYRFPDIPGENFCSEALLFTPIGCDYKVHFFFGHYYESKYYSDGLTMNSLKRRIENINYTLMTYANSYRLKRMPLKYRYRALINLYRFSFFKKGMTLFYLKRIGLFSIPFLFCGIILYCKYLLERKIWVIRD